jgi:nitric oxide reductase NorQ protein
VGFEYSGTNALDRALEERFRVVKMDYPPEEIEAEILRLKTGVNKKPSETIVKVAHTIRDLNRKGEISKGVSVRHTLDAAELEASGFDLKTALELAFLPVFQYAEEEKVLEVLASR